MSSSSDRPGQPAQQQQPPPKNLCQDCGVVFDSSKSLDVHLHYHKENLMNKWGHQATPPPQPPASPSSGEDNNNQVKKARAAPADSSGEPAAFRPQPQPPQFYHQDYQENGGGSAFQRIPRGGYRFQPYQQQPQQQPHPQLQHQAQCDKCGYVCEPQHLIEHVHQAHPPTPTAFFFGGERAIKEEQAEILDLDSHKVHHVYTPEGSAEDASPWHHHQLPSHYPVLEPHEDKREAKGLHYFYHQQEPKRYALEENGGDSSPDFGGVSTTSMASPPQPDVVASFYELAAAAPQRSQPPAHHLQQQQEQVMQLSSSHNNKLLPLQKPATSGGWKSNEARRPKTYNCSACNKWFTSSGHLKRHYNTTLHKNAVKQSGVMDPAALPVSAHHHPPKEAPQPPQPPQPPPPPQPPQFREELQKEAFQPPPPHYLQPHLPELHDFQHQQQQHHEFQQYAQYPNALPPHVSSFGNDAASSEDKLYFEAEPPPSIGGGGALPSFAIQFGPHQPHSGGPPFAEFGGGHVQDVGGLFVEYHHQQTEEEPDLEPAESPSSTIKEEVLVTSSTPSVVQEEPQQPPTVHRCIDCDKTFNKACYLTQHNKSFHSGVKPYKCTTCGKRFTQEYLHLEHLSKHAGEKPYKCEMCPKQFNHKTDLRRHMCLHSGDKPYACRVCGKGFIRKDHMLKHCETHKRKNNHHHQQHQLQQQQQRHQQQHLILMQQQPGQEQGLLHRLQNATSKRIQDQVPPPLLVQ